MGLLDRLVSDLVQDSTGYNPRRLIRRIGGGKLLMAGGAALAGALVLDKMKRQGGETGAGQAAPPAASLARPHLPPLPRSPATAAPQPQRPPELPPLPSVPPAPPKTEVPQDPPGTPPEEISPDQTSPDLEYAIVRTLIAAALADGHLDEAERELIRSRIDEADLPEERQRQLHRDLVLPPTPSELAALAPSAVERESLYLFAALMTRADGRTEARETDWLARLAGTLEIPRERSEELAAQAADPSSSAAEP